jgi:hypothetical protein
MCEAYLANPAGCTPRLPAEGRAGASLAEHFDASPRFATDVALAGIERSGREAPAGDTIDPERSTRLQRFRALLSQIVELGRGKLAPSADYFFSTVNHSG